MAYRSPSVQAAWLSHALWAGLGFVGLSVLAGGVTTWLQGETSAERMALCTIAGAATAAIAWRRAGTALERV